MKRGAVRGSGISPDHKQPRGEDSNMATVPSSIQEEVSDTEEPNLKDIHSLLTAIQGSINSMQGSIAALISDHNKLRSELAEIRSEMVKKNSEVENLNEELKRQNDYVASLELELGRFKKKSERQSSDIEELQENLDELEQYSRKNSLELHGIPEDIDLSTDEVVCKVAQAIGVELIPENIEISHRLYRKKGPKPIIAKFCSHKVKTKVYKARVNLKNITLSSIFQRYAASAQGNQRIFVNENLTRYRGEMMKLAIKKRKDEKILSTWSIDGKIFIKTSPAGRPRQMFSIGEIKEL